MATNKSGPSKDRSLNFSREETLKLTLLLQDHQVITSKKTDNSSNLQKEKAWQTLSSKFNSDAVIYRSIKQLQQKFNNIKKTARKEMSAEKIGRRLTGGGPPPAGPSETTEWLNSIMGESISGLPAIYDCDASDNPSTSNTAEIILLDTTDTNTQANINTSDTFILDTDEKFTTNNTIETEENKENMFDASTPQAMLRKPISKELVTTKNRKKTFTPYEARKKMITHFDKKMELVSVKELREKNILNYALEEHNQNMQQQKELHEKTLELMEEKHKIYLGQQQELHDFKKKLNELILEKTLLEIEKIKKS